MIKLTITNLEIKIANLEIVQTEGKDLASDEVAEEIIDVSKQRT